MIFFHSSTIAVIREYQDRDPMIHANAKRELRVPNFFSFSINPKARCLRAGLLLLLLPQGEQTDTRDLDNLETDTGDITLGLALATETGQEDLVVLVDEVEATVVGD